MNPQVFAEFLSRQGHRIIKTRSSFWYDVQPGFYFYFPYHRLITPDKEELNQLFWKNHCIGMRYFTPMDAVGKSSYMIVCSDRNYDLDFIDAKYARRQTRRGLDHFQIRDICFQELFEIGFPLVQDTLVRQNRKPTTWRQKKWKQYCLATEGLPGFEAWGAFQDDNLASFMVTFQMEDHFTILHHSSATEYLRLYPNNALVFTVTKLKLASPTVNVVSYGPQSLDAPESLDKFKFRMGFQMAPMKQKIMFNPLISLFMSGFTQNFVSNISRLRPGSDFFRKLDGIIRFYREAS
jgi:hypothetical protein